MKNKLALVIGGATYDITFFSPENVVLPQQNPTTEKLLAFELGAKFYLNQTFYTPGGGAANVAMVLNKLGLPTELLTAVGSDEHGNWLLANFKKNNLGLNFLQTSTKPTGLSIIINTSHHAEHVLFSFRGANEDLKIDADELTKKYRSHPFTLLYLSSLSGRFSKSNLAHIFNFKRKNNDLILTWNPGGPQIKNGLTELKPWLKLTDLLVINKDEARELCQKDLSPLALKNTHHLLTVLSQTGPKIVVISDGAFGAHAIYQGKKYFIPAVKTKAKDTTGVGDTFGATLAWALFYTNYNIEKSLSLAAKNAAANLKEIGAQTGLLNKAQLLNN
ncbi:MAG TPA: PfkB family carbohydrate kinase [bacterium]|nr:PfkB family carbohydrate kinase [bacterium]HPL95632.1 PfkB family carbohydrate kinase [bacterium]